MYFRCFGLVYLGSLLAFERKQAFGCGKAWRSDNSILHEQPPVIPTRLKYGGFGKNRLGRPQLLPPPFLSSTSFIATIHRPLTPLRPLFCWGSQNLSLPRPLLSNSSATPLRPASPHNLDPPPRTGGWRTRLRRCRHTWTL